MPFASTGSSCLGQANPPGFPRNQLPLLQETSQFPQGMFPSWQCRSYPSPEERSAEDQQGKDKAQEDDDWREASLRDLIEASNNRCGRSEHAHSKIKSDFAGGMLPSNSFGSNRCWLMVSCMSFNIVALFRRWATGGGDGLHSRMKRLWVCFFQVSGRLVRHANRSMLNMTTNPYLKEAWNRLDKLEPLPP